MAEVKIPTSSGKDEVRTRPDKHVKKVVRTPGKARKKSVAMRIFDSFFNDDIDSIKEYLIYDVAIPAIKNGIVDAITKGTEMLFYGEPRETKKKPKGDGNYVSYSAYYKSDDRHNRRDDTSYRHSRFDYGGVTVATRGEAERVRDGLSELIDQYGEASIKDLYGLAEISGPASDDYGWTNDNFGECGIKVMRDGSYGFNLPRPVLLPHAKK